MAKTLLVSLIADGRRALGPRNKRAKVKLVAIAHDDVTDFAGRDGAADGPWVDAKEFGGFGDRKPQRVVGFCLLGMAWHIFVPNKYRIK